MSQRSFLATVCSTEEQDGARYATFYLMNTSENRNRWGVTFTALEQALLTIIKKPIGCGKDYTIADHYKDPLDVGSFISTEMPASYALGTAEIHDEKVWGFLQSGDWGPISVVILSYKERCSHCWEDLTNLEDPWSHECIKAGLGYVQVTSFVFERADFVDKPAFPQAGLIASDHGHIEPLVLAARLYSQSNEGKPSQKDQATGPGASNSNPGEGKESNLTDNEQLQGRINELEAQAETDKKTIEGLRARVQELEAEDHTELVDEVLAARIAAGVVEDKEDERKALTARTDEDLITLRADAEKYVANLEKDKGSPKSKNSGADEPTELQAAMDDARMRLFGRRR